MGQRAAANFLSLPYTRIGKASGYLLVLGVVLVILNSALLMPFTEKTAGLDSAQAIVNAVVGLSVIASGVCGLLAVLRERERSWVLFVGIVVLVVVLAMMLQDLVAPGQ